MAKKLLSDAQKLEEAVLQTVVREDYHPLTFRELRHALNCPKHLVG